MIKFLLQTQIGIEKITELELFHEFDKKHFSIDNIGFIPHKNGIVQLNWNDLPEKFEYSKLGTIEDAFLIVDYIKDIDSEVTTHDLYKLIGKERIKEGLSVFFDSLNNFDKQKKFRLVVRKKSPHNFRRIDLEETISAFFRNNFSKTQITEEEESKEIWCTLVKNRLIIAVRLTSKEVRHRTYKTESFSGSLRPSVAYSMAFVAELKNKEIVWDPFCGAGTIGCELVENFSFQRLFLTDVDKVAIEKTQIHLNQTKNYKKYKGKVSLNVQNFFESKNYADTIISNLPFGKRFELENDFIKNFFEKVNQISKLNKIVILFPYQITSATWQVHQIYKLHILGQETYLQVLKKFG